MVGNPFDGQFWVFELLPFCGLGFLVRELIIKHKLWVYLCLF